MHVITINLFIFHTIMVTIDFLIGNNHNLAVDKKIKHMQVINKPDDSTKEKLFILIHNVV